MADPWLDRYVRNPQRSHKLTYPPTHTHHAVAGSCTLAVPYNLLLTARRNGQSVLTCTIVFHHTVHVFLL
jgi:hypothetical protein